MSGYQNCRPQVLHKQMTKKIILILLSVPYISLFSQKQVTEKQIDSTFNTLYTIQTQDTDILEPGFTELYYKSRDIDYTKGKIESLLRLSAFYLNRGKDFKKINTSLDEVEKLALEKDDYFYYCKAKALRAGLLSKFSLFNRSMVMLNSGSKLFGQIKNVNERNYIKAYYYGRYINLYALQGRKDSVFFYAQEMYKTSLQLPDKDLQKINFVTIAARVLTDIYTERKQFSEAGYYLKIQEKNIKKLNNVFDIGMYHKTKGTLIFDYDSHKANDLDSALYHFNLAEVYIEIAKSPIVKADLYSQIAEVYKKKNDDENRFFYLDRSVRIKDSLQRIQKNNVSQIDADAMVPEFDQEMINPDDSGGTKFSAIGGYICITLLFLALLIFLWLKKKKYSDHKKSSHKLEIEHKHNSEIPYKSNSKIIELTTQALNGDKDFFINFMKEFPDFGDKLIDINPNIKLSDIEFCAMLRLNLQVKQIAEIKKTSMPAVTVKKGRIRKKLNLGSRENMYMWLCSF